MANISPNTFAALNHYTSVRLQQGVPLVDADWNEMEDIRRFELQAFLKWFVGDGVPAGNDGFRIQPLTNIVFSVTAPGVTFKVKASDAAAELGLATETATSHLAGTTHEPFDLRDTKLAIEFSLKAAQLSAIVQVFEITFASASFHDIAAATASEVADAINQAISAELTKLNSALSFASVANGNDFVIGGGDGTPAGAGRCLVEGWDVLNENDRRYQAQKLYNNFTLAAAWNVDVLPPLTPSDRERTDLIYLDVWERVVDAEEDPDLVNQAIGIETCARLKREWVVRVLEDCDEREVPVNWPLQQKERSIRKSGHVYYALAQLQRKAQQTLIEQSMITDLRRTGLAVPSNLDAKQITTDAYGDTYSLDGDGQPNLKVSLREAINALLKGGLPSSSPFMVTTSARSNDTNVVAVKDTTGNLWIFYTAPDQARVDRIWHKKFNIGLNSWDEEQQLTQNSDGYSNRVPLAVADQQGTIWLFWRSLRDTTAPADADVNYRYKRYEPGRNKWSDTFRLPTTFDPAKDGHQFALADKHDNIWLFWRRIHPDDQYWGDIWYRKFEGRLNTWGEEQQLTTSGGVTNEYPVATEDNNGNLWLFWISYRSQNPGIYYRFYDQAEQKWSNEDQLTKNGSVHAISTALCDQDGMIWIFWSDQTTIWCKTKKGLWSSETSLTTFPASYLHAFLDGNGDIWLFWGRNPVGSGYKRYSRDFGWGREQLIDGFSEGAVTALEDNEGDINVFWNRRDPKWHIPHRQIWHRRLIQSL